VSEPQHGFTRDGVPVHGKVTDHHRHGGFNKAVAIWLTNTVGTMWMFWAFCVWALLSLPAVLSAFAPFAHTFPPFLVKASIIALVAWVAQTFIQLVLLPALMVGQNLQNVAADARAAKTFEDVEAAKQDIERALDLLDVHTEGGIKSVLDRLDAMEQIMKPVRNAKVGT
jgi:uncharacterized membrane protein